MIVKKREWLSEVSREAILIIGDGAHQCTAFSHPCLLDIGDVVSKPLLAVWVDSFYKEICGSELFISQLNDGFEHEIVARVVDVDNKIVSVDGMIIMIDDYIPKDLIRGDVVRFHCGRIDVSQ